MHPPSLSPNLSTPPKIYLLAAHPNWRASRVNQRLLAAARTLADGNPQLDVQDLYANYPDYAIDVAAEQARMEAADLLVLLHPIQWYSMPALQKLWLDEVLTYGWAFGAVSAQTEEAAPPEPPAPPCAARRCGWW